MFCSITIPHGAGLASPWRRSRFPMAQVQGITGASVVLGWRPAPQNGHLRAPMAQVPTLFPHLRQRLCAPAPTTINTCATGTIHLVFSNSSAHGYASHCIYDHLLCFCPFLKTGKSTPMRPRGPAERVSVRLNLKRKVVAIKHQDGPCGKVVRAIGFKVERSQRATEG